jgi:hypothetical protein
MVRALIGFSGAVTMYPGEEREIEDETVLNDLIAAKYIEVIKNESIASDTGDSKRVSKG